MANCAILSYKTVILDLEYDILFKLTLGTIPNVKKLFKGRLHEVFSITYKYRAPEGSSYIRIHNSST